MIYKQCCRKYRAVVYSFTPTEKNAMKGSFFDRLKIEIRLQTVLFCGYGCNVNFVHDYFVYNSSLNGILKYATVLSYCVFARIKYM